MDVLSYTAARTNLAKTMERVCVDHDSVIKPGVELFRYSSQTCH